MKKSLLVSFVLCSFLSFSQEKNQEKIELPLLITTGTNGHFYAVYDRLNMLSKNISDNIVSLKNLNEMRQGLFIISTENIGKPFNTSHLDTRPCLNIELQQIMFTGNFNNPNSRRFPIIIRQ
jgi:hypothetical protein